MHCGREACVDVGVRFPDVARWRQRRFAVFCREEGGVQFRVESLSNPEQCNHAIVHRGEVAQNVDHAVFAGRDFGVEVGVAQPCEEAVDGFEVGRPAIESGFDEGVFVGHLSVLSEVRA